MTDRLQILRDTSVISADVADATRRTAEWLASQVGGAWGGEQCDMLIVHLAMALQRAIDGQPWSGQTSGLEDELAGHHVARSLARETLRRLEAEQGVTFADGEVLLVAAYLATLVQERV